MRKSDSLERNLRQVEGFGARLAILPFGETEARQFAQVKAELERADLPIGAYDMMITRHARSLGLILVTNNVREFKRMEGVGVENWVNNAGDWTSGKSRQELMRGPMAFSKRSKADSQRMGRSFVQALLPLEKRQ